MLMKVVPSIRDIVSVNAGMLVVYCILVFVSWSYFNFNLGKHGVINFVSEKRISWNNRSVVSKWIHVSLSLPQHDMSSALCFVLLKNRYKQIPSRSFVVTSV